MFTTLKQIRTQQQDSVARNRRRERKNPASRGGLGAAAGSLGRSAPHCRPVGPTPPTKPPVVVAGTTLSNVYGTATYGGTATLTATLTQGFTFFPGAYPMASQQVKSALGGKVVGMVPTNSSGVATLPGISISGYGAGTYSGAVRRCRQLRGQLDLWWHDGHRYLDGLSGSDDTHQLVWDRVLRRASDLDRHPNLDAQGAVGNQPVSFWQGTTVVKTANTNTYGVATYLFAPTTFNNVGTYPAAFVANFAGSTNYAAATSVTGTLKVSSAQTTFSSTVYGTWNASTGELDLYATLSSQTTNQGVQGQSVTFDVDGYSFTVSTDSSGDASYSVNVTLTDPNTGNPYQSGDSVDLQATFNGSTNYVLAVGLGDVTVS